MRRVRRTGGGCDGRVSARYLYQREQGCGYLGWRDENTEDLNSQVSTNGGSNDSTSDSVRDLSDPLKQLSHRPSNVQWGSRHDGGLSLQDEAPSSGSDETGTSARSRNKQHKSSECQPENRRYARVGRHAPASRSSSTEEMTDNLTECADVHWLNSLGGTVCLLVDSYRDLGNGIAIEEAFSLVQGHDPSPPGTPPADRVKRALANVAVTRGWAYVPPRLLQEKFPRNVCRGDSKACGDLIAFLKRLHAGDKPSRSHYLAPAPTAGNGGPKNGQSYHHVRTKNIAPTHPSSAGPHQRRGFPVTTIPASKTTESWVNERFCCGHEVPASARSIRGEGPAAADTKGSQRATAGRRRSYRLRKYCDTGTISPAAPRARTARMRLKPPPTDRRASVIAIQGGTSANGRRDHSGGVLLVATGDASTAVVATPRMKESTVGNYCGVRHRGKEAVLVAGGGRRAAGRVIGCVEETVRMAPESSITTVQSAMASGTTVLASMQVGCKKSERGAASVIDEKVGATATATGLGGGLRPSRREILRWMDRLGLKVGLSLLTPEDARCHKSLSSGKLLCELAAAVDYAASGGRGLPLSEVPSCPGRFVLRGTCSVPTNAARSMHNIRTALGAFEFLGGVSGTWLRDEQAILDGDHEVQGATWGLLAAVYSQYGRFRSRYKGGHRAPSLLRKVGPSTSAAPTSKTITAGSAKDKPTTAVRPDDGGGYTGAYRRSRDHSTKDARYNGVRPLGATRTAAVGLMAMNEPRESHWRGPSRPVASADAPFFAKTPPRIRRAVNVDDTAVVTSKLVGGAPHNTRTLGLSIEVPVPPPVFAAVTPRFAGVDNGSAPNARDGNMDSSAPGEETPNRKSISMSLCGRVSAHPQGVVEGNLVLKEEILSIEGQQGTECYDQRSDSPRDGGAVGPFASEKADLPSARQVDAYLSSSDREIIPGWYYAMFNGGLVSRRRERSNPTDTAAFGRGKPSVSEETNHRQQTDTSREGNKHYGSDQSQQRTVTAPDTNLTHHGNGGLIMLNREMTANSQSADQSHHVHSSVDSCSVAPKLIPSRRREEHDIVMHKDCRKHFPLPPPPLSDPSTKIAWMNNTSTTSSRNPHGTAEETEYYGDRNRSLGESKISRAAEGGRGRCPRRGDSSMVIGSDTVDQTPRSRQVSYDDFSFSTTSAPGASSARKYF